MNDYQNPAGELRRQVQASERRRLEPTRQAALQAEAVAKLEAKKAEHEQYLAALITAPSTPNPVVAPSRFKSRFKAKPRAVPSKVALARANQTTQPKKES